jgi:hypothetical protein
VRRRFEGSQRVSGLSIRSSVTYQKNDDTIFTWRERTWALVIGCVMLAAWYLVVDPYVTRARGFLEVMFGVVTLYLFWIAIIGRISNDQS